MRAPNNSSEGVIIARGIDKGTVMDTFLMMRNCGRGGTNQEMSGNASSLTGVIPQMNDEIVETMIDMNGMIGREDRMMTVGVGMGIGIRDGMMTATDMEDGIGIETEVIMSETGIETGGDDDYLCIP
jgi:hypothetical protein